MEKDEKRRVFIAMVLESPDRQGFWPLLRFSEPFATLEAHEALSYLDYAIADIDLAEPDSAITLRRFHLARGLIKQAITHAFMVEGEPPAEPETVVIEQEGKGTLQYEDRDTSEDLDYRIDSERDAALADLADDGHSGPADDSLGGGSDSGEVSDRDVERPGSDVDEPGRSADEQDCGDDTRGGTPSDTRVFDQGSSGAVSD